MHPLPILAWGAPSSDIILPQYPLIVQPLQAHSSVCPESVLLWPSGNILSRVNAFNHKIVSASGIMSNPSQRPPSWPEN
jgi:hypothetical protein